MIVGMDLYKDSSDRNQSVLAFVATMNGDDQNCNRYYSRIVMQERKATYADRLQILLQGIKLLHKINKRLLKRIDSCFATNVKTHWTNMQRLIVIYQTEL